MSVTLYLRNASVTQSKARRALPCSSMTVSPASGPSRTASLDELAATPRHDHPLKRLWRYAGGHRRTIVVASTFSVLNKLFDLAPPFLIGAAVDIVVTSTGATTPIVRRPGARRWP